MHCPHLGLPTSSGPLVENAALTLPNTPPCLCPQHVPLIVAACCRIVEARGLESTGIYRVPGNNAVVSSLQEQLNRGPGDINLQDEVGMARGSCGRGAEAVCVCVTFVLIVPCNVPSTGPEHQDGYGRACPCCPALGMASPQLKLNK